MSKILSILASFIGLVSVTVVLSACGSASSIGVVGNYSWKYATSSTETDFDGSALALGHDGNTCFEIMDWQPYSVEGTPFEGTYNIDDTNINIAFDAFDMTGTIENNELVLYADSNSVIDTGWSSEIITCKLATNTDAYNFGTDYDINDFDIYELVQIVRYRDMITATLSFDGNGQGELSYQSNYSQDFFYPNFTMINFDYTVRSNAIYIYYDCHIGGIKQTSKITVTSSDLTLKVTKDGNDLFSFLYIPDAALPIIFEKT